MNIKQTIIVPLCAAALSLQAQTTGGKGLQVSWASKDVHYAQTERPVMRATSDTLIKAWRGERVGVEAVVYAAQKQSALQVRLTPWRKGGATIAASQGEARFINYVTTDNFQYCGYHPNDLTPYQVADVIDLDVPQTAEEGTTHPVWCTLEVPADADAGVYSTQLEVADAQTHKVLKRLNLKIEVNARTLPSPAEQKFHVDFWQQPYAVSRYNGEWQYDYTVFDQWVKLCEECGISEQINCFSMVPWDMSFRYYDEAQGKEVDLKTTTSSAEYKALWTAFLKSFAAHLKQQGWYDKTCIAMDERGLNNMLDAYRVAQEAVPGIKIALAGTHHKELVDKLYDYCIGFGEHFTDDELAARKARGWKSTTYTCCSNTEPNLFSNSLPAEAAYLPVFCVANKFEGYLHWSWMNWADNPLTDTRFRLFAPGDTYLIYPGPRSSVRYERFIEGVAMAEKVRILREEYAAKGNNAALDALNKQVETFAPAGIPTGQTAAGMVNALQQLLNP